MKHWNGGEKGMWECPNCGELNDDDVWECEYCGDSEEDVNYGWVGENYG